MAGVITVRKSGHGGSESVSPNAVLRVRSNSMGDEVQLSEGLISDNGTVVTVAGNLTVTGTLTGGGSGGASLTADQSFSGINTFTQNVVAPNIVSPLSFYGILYNSSTWPNLTGFTPNGVTPTVVSNKLQFTGGANTLTQSLDYEYYTDLYHWKITARFLVGTPGATTYGMGVGIQGASNTGVGATVMAALDLTNTGTAGQLSIRNRAGANTNAAIAVSFSAGDYVVITFSRDEEVFYATAYNDTTHSLPVTVGSRPDFLYYNASGNSNAINIGKFAVFNLGGTQTLDSLKIESSEMKHADILVLGDSKSSSVFSGLYLEAYPTLLQQTFRTVNLSGSGQWLLDGINLLPEILALVPKTIVLNLGRNDLGAGTAVGTVNTRYDSLVSSLTAAGIDVFHLLPLYEVVLDQSAFASHITSTYPANRIIDAGGSRYIGTASNILSPDNVHPNRYYNQLIAEAIKSAYYAQFPQYFPYQNRSQIYQDGNFNLTVGVSALQYTVSQVGGGANGICNTGIGFRVLDRVTIGGYNTAGGYLSLNLLTSGNKNTAFGFNTLPNLTSGTDNSAFGQGAILNLLTGGFNSAFGSLSIGVGTGGSNNSGFGYGTLYSVTGQDNTAVGYTAGSALTSGGFNTILGSRVGSTTLATGSGNILIGVSAGVDTPTSNTSNYLNIGSLIFGDISATKKISFLAVTTPVVQQTRGATLTNNITSHGTSETCADFSDLTVFANSAQIIHDNEYWMAHAIAQHDVALRAYGLLT